MNINSSNGYHQQCMEEIKRKLHEKHGSMFIPMQYRGWAELLAINAHSSYNFPPPYPVVVKQLETSQS